MFDTLSRLCIPTIKIPRSDFLVQAITSNVTIKMTAFVGPCTITEHEPYCLLGKKATFAFLEVACVVEGLRIRAVNAHW